MRSRLKISVRPENYFFYHALAFFYKGDQNKQSKQSTDNFNGKDLIIVILATPLVCYHKLLILIFFPFRFVACLDFDHVL